MAAVQGALLAIILGAIGYRIALRRYYILAAIALATGIGTAIFQSDEIISSMVVYMITGTIMFIWGSLIFINYVRQHPQPRAE